MPHKIGDFLTIDNQTFEIIEVLGEGSYGTVFRSRDENANFVVIKEFHDTASTNEKDRLYQRALFWREGQVLADASHPKIPKFYGKGSDDPETVNPIDTRHMLPPETGDLYLAMELVQGATLRKVFDDFRLANNGQPFPSETVIAIGMQLCEVIHYLHTLPGQVIYRDLKPENVMWDSVRQEVRLIDFGTARFSSENRRATQGLGTEGYAPPELYASRAELSFSTDVFTIGALLYELLTGDTPEPRSVPANFRGYDAQIPPALQKVVLMALQLDPLSRYQTADAMREALEAAGQSAFGTDFNSAELMEQVGAPRATNLHPLLSCFCAHCGAVPRTDKAIYCGKCRGLIHTVMLRVFPRDAPPTLLYLQKSESQLGRTDPDTGVFPDVDLSRFDAGRYVSRHHATIKRDGVRFFLTAHKTLNPTRVGGFVVSSGATVPLENESRLEFADLVCNFVVRPVVNP